MTTAEITTCLRQAGIQEGRMVSWSKSRYSKNHPKHFVVFNAKVFTRRAQILRQVDLDLTLDAQTLTRVARIIRTNLYVLYESAGQRLGEPDSTPILQILRNAVWWSRIRPEDQDVFLPMDSPRRPQSHVCLSCSAGVWLGEPAYSVDLSDDPQWGGDNMLGARATILGSPPNLLHLEDRGHVFAEQPSATRGRPVRPVLYHRAGLLEYVWFTNHIAVPAVLYDLTVASFDNVRFAWHRDKRALHVRRAGELVGLVWPACILAPEVIDGARRQLQLLTRSASRAGEGAAETISQP